MCPSQSSATHGKQTGEGAMEGEKRERKRKLKYTN